MALPNFEELKTQIAEVVAICKDVPEEFRARCFEMLLGSLLHSQKPQEKLTRDKDEPEEEEQDEDEDDEMPAGNLQPKGNVKAFLRKKSVTDDDLNKLVMLEDGELHFLKEPLHKNSAKGQNDWALLLALKNAIMSGNFTVDPEEVRSTAQDKGYYDKGNFASNFKKDKYAAWYKGPMEPQGAPQALSGDGETALAELIKSLIAS